jgi:hypothetical protein
MDHVESRRLCELAEMPAVVYEPKWLHIKDNTGLASKPIASTSCLVKANNAISKNSCHRRL